MRIAIDIGRKIKMARRTKGLTLQQLAKQSGVSYVTLSRIERGYVIPRRSTIKKLIDVLNIPENEAYIETVLNEAPFLNALEVSNNSRDSYVLMKKDGSFQFVSVRDLVEYYGGTYIALLYNVRKTLIKK